MEIWAVKDLRRRSVDISFVKVVGKSMISIAQPLVFKNEDDNTAIEPSVTLSLEDAVSLMTELWNAGIRPAEVGTTGELAALKYHLEDMRKLVFKLPVTK